jgi:hypothetical protein
MPTRRRGGHELPDDVQDRPEQNAGYDAAVRGERGSPVRTVDEAEIVPLTDGEPRSKGIRIERDQRRRTGGR